MEHGTIQILVTWEKHPETGQLKLHSEFNIKALSSRATILGLEPVIIEKIKEYIKTINTKEPGAAIRGSNDTK